MVDRMMQFFEYKHLPERLQSVSAPFGQLAQWMVDMLPMNAERTAGLRKLLEAKDCAVRAKLYVDPEQEKIGGAPPPNTGMPTGGS